jgi:hypothetical protein
VVNKKHPWLISFLDRIDAIGAGNGLAQSTLFDLDRYSDQSDYSATLGLSISNPKPNNFVASNSSEPGCFK